MIRSVSHILRLAGLLFLISAFPSASLAQEFIVWQAYNLKFEIDPDRPVLLASFYVLNPTGADYRDLSFSVGAPEGFSIEKAPEEIQKASRRPRGFREELVDGTYRMHQPFLGANQAATIFYELTFDKPPVEVTFPGVRIEYRHRDEERVFEAVDETHNLSRIRRFSGDGSDFIKRHADVSLDLEGEWTFTALDYRAFAQNSIGIVSITGSPEGSGHFRVQQGFPGDFKEILVRWEHRSRGRKEPITPELAREEMETMIRWVGDFRPDADTIQVESTKVARYDAVLVRGRWLDNKPVRLGSGLFRLYAVHDPRGDRDFFLYLGVQGRGIGPEHADTPADEREHELMEQLVDVISTFRP